jgi:hypothetical protein
MEHPAASDPLICYQQRGTAVKATRTCSVEGCDRAAQKREWCRRHYDGMRRRGELSLLPIYSTAERLAAYLVEMPSGCIEWTRYTDHAGYGKLSVNSAPVATHRLAWELANGPIPKGLGVLHRCDNPPCCNVAHLFLGTQVENIADMRAKDRDRTNGYELRSHCSHGHSFDESNTYLNPQGVRICRACKRASDTRRRVDAYRQSRGVEGSPA